MIRWSGGEWSPPLHCYCPLIITSTKSDSNLHLSEPVRPMELHHEAFGVKAWDGCVIYERSVGLERCFFPGLFKIKNLLHPSFAVDGQMHIWWLKWWGNVSWDFFFPRRGSVGSTSGETTTSRVRLFTPGKPLRQVRVREVPGSSSSTFIVLPPLLISWFALRRFDCISRDERLIFFSYSVVNCFDNNNNSNYSIVFLKSVY